VLLAPVGVRAEPSAAARCERSADVFEATLGCQQAERWEACLERATAGWGSRKGEDNRRTLARYAATCAQQLCLDDEAERWEERACQGLQATARAACETELEESRPLCVSTAGRIALGAAVVAGAVATVAAVLLLGEPEEVELVFTGRF